MIYSEIKKDDISNKTSLLVKVYLDDELYSSIERGENKGIGDAIVKEIVKNIYPEMEKRIFSDPTYKDRVIGEVLNLMANKIAFRLEELEKEIKNKLK